jgi:hypothetical protein
VEEIDSGEYPVGLKQVLAETLAADTTYVLSVQVGNNFYYTSGDYVIELLAGENVLNSFGENAEANIVDDTFELRTVTHTSGGVSDPNVGQPLEIRLVLTAGEEVDFDDVELLIDGESGVEVYDTEMSAVTLTLAVNDAVGSVDDTMTIDVYDTPCLAARIGLELAADHPADFDESCITGLEDLAVMVAKWLDDHGLTAPVPK